jgi:mono/diheme cytochrome c family protein
MDSGTDSQVGPGASDAGVARLDAPAFCGRANDDITKLFCGSQPPDITSLAALTHALRVDRALRLGHSTGLGARLVSPINPRAVLLGSGSFSQGFVAATFTRGVQQVELVSLDHTTRRFNFYLLEFSQACNTNPRGCTPGDRFTTAIEENWLDVRLRGDEALKNTRDDCRRCHGGAPSDGGKPMLLMRELDNPWLHWFSMQFSTLQQDYQSAKGAEPYAGVTQVADPGLLENQIRNAEGAMAQPQQPLLFRSGLIGLETMEFQTIALRPGPGANNPDLAPSPTWQVLYDAYLNGTGPAPPYHHGRITDAAKLAVASDAYQAFLAGRIAKDDLLDISDVLPDDQHRLAEMGFAVEPDATKGDLLLQGCAACHNAGLDQTLTRAHFDADLSRVQPEELALAIARLELPSDDPHTMPPLGARPLNAEQREALIAYLSTVDPATVPPRAIPQPVPRAYSLEPVLHLQRSDYPGAGLVIGDLTGDGRPDLASPPWFFEQRSDHTLSDPMLLPASLVTYSAIVDVNADGRADIVSFGSPRTNDPNEKLGLRTFLSLGGFSFSPGIPSDGPNIRELSRAQFTDVNRDGHLDLVSLTSDPNLRVVAYFGDGQGRFSASAVMLDDSADATYSASAVGDVTGDSIDDLVLLDRSSPPAIVVYEHDGVSGFRRTSARYLLPASAAISAHFVIGDSNNDGRNDVVVSDQPSVGSATRLLLQNADGRLGSAPVIDSRSGPTVFADMNHDGRQDLVIVSTSDGAVRVLLQGPSGLQNVRSLVFQIPMTPGSVLDMLAVDDLNSDGCPDVAVARNGSIAVLRGVGCEP